MTNIEKKKSFIILLHVRRYYVDFISVLMWSESDVIWFTEIPQIKIEKATFARGGQLIPMNLGARQLVSDTVWESRHSFQSIPYK